MSAFDVVSVGSVTQDVFLSGDAFKPHKEEDGELVEEFQLGAKIEVDNVTFSTGGGASNAAVTFARHGLRSAFLGSIGDDTAGKNVIEMFNEENIDHSFIAYDETFNTDYSTLLVTPSGERTILIYRGASHNLSLSDYDLSSLSADWLYVTSVAGNMEFLHRLVDEADKKNIKVAIDPGSKELAQREEMLQILPKLHMIKGNVEEMGSLVDSDDAQSIARQLADKVNFVIVTDGAKGSWATDGKQLVRAGMYEDVPVLDRTGAGDAFGSGFITSLVEGGSLRNAITYGSANSTSVVQHIGAKKGILQKGAEVHDMELEIHEL